MNRYCGILTRSSCLRNRLFTFKCASHRRPSTSASQAAFKSKRIAFWHDVRNLYARGVSSSARAGLLRLPTQKGNVRIHRMCAVLERNIVKAPSQLLLQSYAAQVVRHGSLWRGESTHFQAFVKGAISELARGSREPRRSNGYGFKDQR